MVMKTEVRAANQRRVEARSPIDMIALLDIGLQFAGGALVALADQVPVLPKGAARLNASRVVKSGNHRSKELYENVFALAAKAGGAGRPDAGRRK